MNTIPRHSDSSLKDIPPPSPHNILIMGAAFFRSFWSSLFSFVRLHCRYLFAWNRPVRRSFVMKPAPNPPLENSVPIWYRSLRAALVSPSCTNHGFLPGMSHLLSGCGTEQALCARWYITIDQPIYTRLLEPPGGLIEPSMSCRCTKKQPAFGNSAKHRRLNFICLIGSDIFQNVLLCASPHNKSTTAIGHSPNPVHFH